MAKQLIAKRFEVEINDNQDNFIGQGGMGTVFIGRDTTEMTPVAIKLLKPEVLREDPEMVRRFQIEGETLRRLNHPNIVKMLAAEDQGNSHYLVMEYVGGGSLRDILDENPQLSIQRTLYIALDLADALTRAHRLNVLHRDIKPANVLLAEDGTPRLTDFGMARVKDVHVTQSGMIVGTLSYLSPEALHGENIDERADIWAFGVMLFEMIAGNRPFPETAPGALINSILAKPVPDLETIRPDAPTALVDLIYRMLEKDVHARVPSVRLIGAELEAIIRGNTSSMQPVISADTTGRFVTPTPNTLSDQMRQSQILPVHHIPTAPTAFVGREAELSELATLINDPAIRLITILGPGGMGKTRIAISTAEQHLQAFPDGVFFIELAGVEDPNRIVASIADELDFTFSGKEEPKADLLNFLAEKNMLLVLDNFEHLTDGASLVSDILNVAPNLTILVTSRERLRLRGEHIFEIDGMILPRQNANPEQLLDYPAVQLFMQSARRVMPDFEIDGDTAPYVSKVIRLVQGLPLGIELAAAWIEMLPIDEIADEIEKSLDFLETDLRDVPERHRSIRAVFEYSWNLMSEEEKDVFLKLSIFRGGFEREAAQKITGASLRNLTSLVNKSLLMRMPSGRYQAHKLLRQYAEERFNDSSEKQAVYDEHCKYYGEFLMKIAPIFNTTKEHSAVESIEEEIENILIAWHWTVKQELWDEIDHGIFPMMLFYQARSMLNEGIAVMRELASAMKKKGKTDHPAYHRARSREAWLLSRQGDYEYVYQLSEESYQYFLKTGDNDEITYALNNMSYAMMLLGKYAKAQELASQALDYCADPTTGNITPYFFTMGNLGYAEYLLGNLHEAKNIYEKINNLSEDLNYSPIGLAYGLNNLGEIERNLGDMQRAQDLFAQAYEIFQNYKNLRGMAFSLNNLGGVMFLLGNTHGAGEKYAEGYRMHREVGDLTGTAHSLSALGNVSMFDGDYDSARDYYGEALQIRRGLGNLRGVADSLNDLATLEMNIAHFDRADELIDEALEIRERINDKQGLALAKTNKALTQLYQENYELSASLILEALALSRETNNLYALAQSLIGVGILNIIKKNYAEAEASIVEALQMVANFGSLAMILLGITVYAQLQKDLGNYETALMLIEQVRLYPSNYMRITEYKANKLYEQLLIDLDGDAIRAATERGRSLDLDAYIRELTAG